MGAKVKIISEPKAWVTSLIYRTHVKIGEMDVMKEEVTYFINIGNVSFMFHALPDFLLG